ncbi:MAG: adenylate/guanylate cyclase domain-containing protein [Rhodospirillales bacterium]
MNAPNPASFGDIVRDFIRMEAERPILPVAFGFLCQRLRNAGISLWRASLNLQTLHPEMGGSQIIWRDGVLEGNSTDRASLFSVTNYNQSPMRVITETARPFRQRLTESTRDMPVLADLKQQGVTDYIMIPLPFIDHGRLAAISYASRGADGFNDQDIQNLTAGAHLFSPYAERNVLHRIANNLLDAYLGPLAGRRIYQGEIVRGELQTMLAAIWFCDLRGFTALSETMPRKQTVDLLDRWFDVIADALDKNGGEILKFMGDGLLAVFPIHDGDAAMVCAKALTAARKAFADTKTLNHKLQQEGMPELRFGLALHMGEVEFGNIGARRRLDFTVIGPAVNHASRMESLTKTVGHPAVASSVFAAVSPQGLSSLGRFTLRGLADDVEIFAVDGL